MPGVQKAPGFLIHNQMPVLIADKLSNDKEKTLYAKAGEKLTVISDCGNVYIVENKKGNRFSVKKDEVI